MVWPWPTTSPASRPGIKLDGPTLAGIFDGSITTWNASQIAALNPGVTLPAHAITPEVRADSSGTTYIFTDYLASAEPTAWTLGSVEDHRLAVGGGADPEELGRGVVDPVHPVLDRLRRAVLRHPEQDELRGRQELGRHLRGARARPRWPPTPTRRPGVTATDFSIVNQAGATSYPIAGYSWAILLQKQTSATTGAQVVKVLDWTTHTGGGQDLAAGLHYVPLPPAVQNQNRTQLLTVTGPSGQALLTK